MPGDFSASSGRPQEYARFSGLRELKTPILGLGTLFARTFKSLTAHLGLEEPDFGPIVALG